MLCGIDEAGRGCLAGPLVVAGVILHKRVRGLKDSKLLTAQKRESLYERIIQNSSYKIVFTDNSLIDQIGLSLAIKNSIEEIIETLQPQKTIMDGNTTFGVKNVTAIVKADLSIKEVSAASILAKVSRDRFIVEKAKEYPLYGFEDHKGYGTKDHIAAIKKYGLCDLHRKSFKIKRFNQPTLF